MRKRVSPTMIAGVGAGHGHGRVVVPGALPLSAEWKSRFLVVLDKMEHVPSIMSVTQLIQTPRLPAPTDIPFTEVDALRLIELTDRTSDLMRSSAVEDIMVRDPLLNIYRKFGGLNNIVVADRLAVTQSEMYHETVGAFAREGESQMVLLSWATPLPSSADDANAMQHASTSAALTAAATSPTEPQSDPQATHTSNPLEGLFRSANAVPSRSRHERLTSVAHSHFIRRVFATSPVDVGLFIDSQNGGGYMGSGVHILVPFFGGPDDRLALEFAVQLCAREEVTASVFKMIKEIPTPQEGSSSDADADSKGPSTKDAPTTRPEKEPQHLTTGLTAHGTMHSVSVSIFVTLSFT